VPFPPPEGFPQPFYQDYPGVGEAYAIPYLFETIPLSPSHDPGGSDPQAPVETGDPDSLEAMWCLLEETGATPPAMRHEGDAGAGPSRLREEIAAWNQDPEQAVENWAHTGMPHPCRAATGIDEAQVRMRTTRSLPTSSSLQTSLPAWRPTGLLVNRHLNRLNRRRLSYTTRTKSSQTFQPVSTRRPMTPPLHTPSCRWRNMTLPSARSSPFRRSTQPSFVRPITRMTKVKAKDDLCPSHLLQPLPNSPSRDISRHQPIRPHHSASIRTISNEMASGLIGKRPLQLQLSERPFIQQLKTRCGKKEWPRVPV
jgi:hypothetical protein